MNPIAKLTSLGGAALGEAIASMDAIEHLGLFDLLSKKNGFYAFESALHVFPAASGSQGLDGWNSASGWRTDYHGLADGCFFFAEDAFGGQFCLFNGSVVSFDPETGERNPLASSIEEWAQHILDDYEVLTGYSLAHEWQKENGPIPAGKRLVPKVPFVLGGEFKTENLFLIEADQGMRSRANLAVQIMNLPEGAEVSFKLID